MPPLRIPGAAPNTGMSILMIYDMIHGGRTLDITGMMAKATMFNLSVLDQKKSNEGGR